MSQGLKRETWPCSQCGKPVTRPPSYFRNKSRVFCDRDCYTQWQTGRSRGSPSDEHRAKISRSLRANKSFMADRADQFREYNLTVKKGHTWEEIYGVEKATAMRQHYRKMLCGENNPNYGNDKLMGANNPNWHGGIANELYGTEFDETLKDMIRERDDYCCKLCGISQQEHIELNGRKLPVHHIDYCKRNNSPQNLITVCSQCYGKTNGSREYYTQMLSKLVSERNECIVQP